MYLVLRRVVELGNQLLPLAHRRATIKTQKGVRSLSAKRSHQVERLRVVAHDDNPERVCTGGTQQDHLASSSSAAR